MSYEDIWKKAQAEQAGAKQRKLQRHEESRLQEACVTWFRLQYPKLTLLLFAVPNGGSRTRRTIVRAGRVITYSPEIQQMKKEGLTPGVADLILLKPSSGYASLCIEMKTTEKGSQQRESQKIWQQAAEQAGNKYVVCRTLEEFMKVVNEYLEPHGKRT